MGVLNRHFTKGKGKFSKCRLKPGWEINYARIAKVSWQDQVLTKIYSKWKQIRTAIQEFRRRKLYTYIHTYLSYAPAISLLNTNLREIKI